MARDKLTDIAWQDMSQILDREMPVEKKRRRILFWWLWPIAALLLSLLLYWVRYTDDTYLENSLNTAIASSQAISDMTKTEDLSSRKTLSSDQPNDADARRLTFDQADSKKSDTQFSPRSRPMTQQPTLRDNHKIVKSTNPKKTETYNSVTKSLTLKNTVKPILQAENRSELTSYTLVPVRSGEPVIQNSPYLPIPKMTEVYPEISKSWSYHLSLSQSYWQFSDQRWSTGLGLGLGRQIYGRWSISAMTQLDYIYLLGSALDSSAETDVLDDTPDNSAGNAPEAAVTPSANHWVWQYQIGIDYTLHPRWTIGASIGQAWHSSLSDQDDTRFTPDAMMTKLEQTLYYRASVRYRLSPRWSAAVDYTRFARNFSETITIDEAVERWSLGLQWRF